MLPRSKALAAAAAAALIATGAGLSVATASAATSGASTEPGIAKSSGSRADPLEGELKAGEQVDVTRLAVIGSLALFLLIGWRLRRLVVGTDGRMSTSKTTAATWTSLVAGALFAFVISRFFDYSDPLDNMMKSGLAGQYGLLIGGPIGAAFAAKSIVSQQVENDPTAKVEVKDEAPKLRNLVQNDSGDTDLGDFQYILFNFVAMVYFVGSLVDLPTAGFPHIPDVLLGPTSLSAVGYVTKKAIKPTSAAKLELLDGAIRITGPGLLPPGPADPAAVTVLFDTAPADSTAVTTSSAAGVDTIEVRLPAVLTAGQEVHVTVVTRSAGVVYTGSFKPA